ncbi:MAG: hypothetical protein ACFE0J_12280 [Elainellaceae cyanobacterium]
MTSKNVNVPMGKDEKVLGECVLSYSILLFFIKSKFYLTNKRLIATIPNVILFIIPLGENTATYTLRNVSAITTVIKFKFFSLVLASIILLVGFSLLSQSPVGIVLLLIGVVMAIESFVTQIRLQSAGNAGVSYRVAVWEKAKAQQFSNQVNQALADL